MPNTLQKCQRVVIKVGTSILTSGDGHFSPANLEMFGGQVLELLRKKKEVVVVSSGAVGLGMDAARLKKRPKEMRRLQACAAIGQGKLMHAYEQFFSKAGMHTAQVLLTRDGLEDRKRFLIARQTFAELLKMKVLPIVNENDTVATEEIAFGDNDILSVHVAHLVQADLLIILSDVDGFYLRDGSRIRQVFSSKQIDSELVKHLRDRVREKTVGGMRAKLEAARVAMRLGVPLWIVSGRDDRILNKALAGEDIGTLFKPEASFQNLRKKWIAFSAGRSGKVVVDAGAFEALCRKRSLLPRGIVEVAGAFENGDVVELQCVDGRIFGRGVVRYSNGELSKILGKKTEEIKAVLGYKRQDEVIHSNDLVIWV